MHTSFQAMMGRAEIETWTIRLNSGEMLDFRVFGILGGRVGKARFIDLGCMIPNF